MFRVLINSADMAPLESAVMQNNTEVAEELIKAGADFNASDNDGKTLLHCAVMCLTVR